MRSESSDYHTMVMLRQLQISSMVVRVRVRQSVHVVMKCTAAMMTLWIVGDGDDGPFSCLTFKAVDEYRIFYVVLYVALLSVVLLIRPAREMCSSLSEVEGQRMTDGILYSIIYAVHTALV
jgi:hypothetical protein